MIYKNEDGNYHIRILMLQEQCKQLKLAYPLEVDVCVCEAERSKEWEESIREKIEDALYEMYTEHGLRKLRGTGSWKKKGSCRKKRILSLK